jgi:predicted tellurium resistance membrane protein TerC
LEFIAEEVRLTIKIILIDMVLSADNAIVIGLAAAQFDPKIRKKVVLIGTALAVLFRLFFALFVAYFFSLRVLELLVEFYYFISLINFTKILLRTKYIMQNF